MVDYATFIVERRRVHGCDLTALFADGAAFGALVANLAGRAATFDYELVGGSTFSASSPGRRFHNGPWEGSRYCGPFATAGGPRLTANG